MNTCTRKRKARFLFSGHFGEAGGAEIPPCKLAKGISKHLHQDYLLLVDSNKLWWAVGRLELTDIRRTREHQPCSVGGNTGSGVSGKTRIHPICILSRKCFYIFEFHAILGLNIYEDFFSHLTTERWKKSKEDIKYLRKPRIEKMTLFLHWQ